VFFLIIENPPLLSEVANHRPITIREPPYASLGLRFSKVFFQSQAASTFAHDFDNFEF